MNVSTAFLRFSFCNLANFANFAVLQNENKQMIKGLFKVAV